MMVRMGLVAWVGLVACTPAAAPTTSPEAAPVVPAAEVCLLGNYEVAVQQRLAEDSGQTALLEDQRIGAVPVLFRAQRAAFEQPPAEPGAPPPSVPNAPPTLLLVVGAQVSETLEDLEVVENGGAKPTQTRTVRKGYTFFLADVAWDCAAVAAELDALKLPQGQVGSAACVPAAVRERCTPVEMTAPAKP